ncbi:MAG: signal peptide peptidase SppA [Rikenellaceae bacterium]|nr:signal peptide peptidase SppA [Rikenellaceae bacterium]
MNFFKSFLAALLAFVAGGVVMIILTFAVIGGLAAMFGDDTVVVEPGSVLTIDLNETIVDSPKSGAANFDYLNMSVSSGLPLYKALTAIEAAADDDNILGIVIRDTPSVGMAGAEELRAALLRFKENSGKFVVSYSETWGQLGYYLASVSDKVYMNPEGGMSWQGLASQIMFYKGLLDKLGVEPIVLRHGSFKSAVEPYIMDKMSPENRLQMEVLLGTVWNTVLEDISASRGIPVETLDRYATELAVNLPEDAVETGLVDGLLYEDQFDDLLRKLAVSDSLLLTWQGDVIADSMEMSEQVPASVSLSSYASHVSLNPKSISKNKIAVIYADGQIVDGGNSRGAIGGNAMMEEFARAREDEKVKAVVLRVNSPGGSALASELMWREIELLKAEKPVIVSMGEYAASGGYYISCPGDVILADRMTITGSIGVFGLLYNYGPALKEKLGITVDIAQTNPSADMGSPFRNLSKREYDAAMQGIERVYSTFIGHVAEGRNMTVEAVDAIGGGRVWSGVSGKEIGLVDGFGGLMDAILLAADRAGVADDFRVQEYVQDEDKFAMIISALSAKVSGRAALEAQLGEFASVYNNLRDVLGQTGVQARMAYDITIE